MLWNTIWWINQDPDTEFYCLSRQNVSIWHSENIQGSDDIKGIDDIDQKSWFLVSQFEYVLQEDFEDISGKNEESRQQLHLQ